MMALLSVLRFNKCVLTLTLLPGFDFGFEKCHLVFKLLHPKVVAERNFGEWLDSVFNDRNKMKAVGSSS